MLCRKYQLLKCIFDIHVITCTHTTQTHACAHTHTVMAHRTHTQTDKHRWHTHTCITHTRTHARTQARTHTHKHTHSLTYTHTHTHYTFIAVAGGKVHRRLQWSLSQMNRKRRLSVELRPLVQSHRPCAKLVLPPRAFLYTNTLHHCDTTRLVKYTHVNKCVPLQCECLFLW